MGELGWGEARGGVTCFGSFFLCTILYHYYNE